MNNTKTDAGIDKTRISSDSDQNSRISGSKGVLIDLPKPYDYFFSTRMRFEDEEIASSRWKNEN